MQGVLRSDPVLECPFKFLILNKNHIFNHYIRSFISSQNTIRIRSNVDQSIQYIFTLDLQFLLIVKSTMVLFWIVNYWLS